MNHVMMACGHTSNATRADGSPCCAICAGLTPKADAVAVAPNLTGRLALCPDCKRRQPSSLDLAFFQYRGPGSPAAADLCDVCGFHRGMHDLRILAKHLPPTRACNTFQPSVGGYADDTYYCGCRGWD